MLTILAILALVMVILALVGLGCWLAGVMDLFDLVIWGGEAFKLIGTGIAYAVVAIAHLVSQSQS